MKIETVYIVHYFSMILIALSLHYKFKLEWKKVLKLVVLPLILLGIGGFIALALSFYLDGGVLEGFLIFSGSGVVSLFMVLYMMFPALLLFAVSMEIVEKRFKPKRSKLFLWSLGLSALIISLHVLFMLSDFSLDWIGIAILLILASIFMGVLSVMMLYGEKEK